MTLSAPGTLEMDMEVQCMCMLVHWESLRQFELMSTDAENMDTSLTVKYLLKG